MNRGRRVAAGLSALALAACAGETTTPATSQSPPSFSAPSASGRSTTSAASTAGQTSTGTVSVPATPGSSASPGTITLAFGGDVHFEEHVRTLLDDGQGTWSTRLPLLRSADLAMVNLETAITDRGTPQPKAYTFRAPATALSALRWAGIDVITMANNHAADFGSIGLEDTLAAKHSGTMPVIGVGEDAAEAYAPYRTTIHGVRIAIVAAMQIPDETTASRFAAGDGKPGVAVALDRTRLLRAVRAARGDADLVVVYMHWGTERTTCPDARQRAAASDLAAAGADVVVGTHAHRPQASGWLGSTFVGYGTGNLVWWNHEPLGRPSGVLTLSVDVAQAKARRPGHSPVTGYVWHPLYVSATTGVPEEPDAGALARLEAQGHKAIECSGLVQTPPG